MVYEGQSNAEFKIGETQGLGNPAWGLRTSHSLSHNISQDCLEDGGLKKMGQWNTIK